MVVVYNIPLRIVLLLLSFAFLAAKRKPPSGTRSTATTAKSLSAIENWRIYPVRSQDEAAVIEYGHSAIISALDAAVAHFGPQTTQAALLEVETMPVLADPVDGVGDLMNDEPFKTSPAGIRLLDNADELHGNVAVMTDVAIQKKNNKKNAVGGGSVLTGLDLALMAQASGAAALMLVHVDESRPDDMYRLEIPPGREEEAASIDIPIVVISLASATVLTTATVPDDNVRPEDIVNNGMPDRIRLYAGGDRPFFEDVEAVEPTIYMIHNLLTSIECDTLIQRADPLVTPVTKADALQLTVDPSPFVNVDRVMLWEGALQGPGGKAIDERIEQITGFPSQHYSDWTVDRLKSGSHWNPHYDLLPSNFAPLATITVFLSGVSDGGEMVFPSTQTSPVKIRPVKGLAVVHHNSNEKQEFDVNSIHGLLPVAPDDKDAVLYIGRKYILPDPVSKARRTGLPVVSWASGGKLPAVFVKLHDGLTGHFGFENGSTYFDKIIVFTPIFLFLIVAQYVGQLVHKHLKETGVVSPPLETKNSIASKNDSVSKIQPGESKVAKKSSKKRN